MRLLKRIFFVAIIGAVATGIAAYVFREALFGAALGYYLRPSVSFDLANAPTAPDYADPANWAALPDREDASDWLPSGYTESEFPQRGGVDVFYIHPTGFFGTGNWNAAMGERSERGIPTEAMLASQASAFNGVGNVYAPEYRQATLYSFLEDEREPGKTNGRQALDLAYEDVARAFDHFIAEFNEGRPFILASHSQGTCHALRLVAEKIDSTDLHRRMIAGYLIGFGMPMDYFERVYANVKPGIEPAQTGCIVTWDTLREGVRPEIGGLQRYPGGWESGAEKPRFQINPLSWTDTDERIAASENKGALVTDMGGLGEPNLTPGMLKAVEPGTTWAQRIGNAVYVRDLTDTPFDTIMSTSGNYHLFDFHLFWADIRENAVVRAKAWLAANAAPAPPAGAV